MKILFSFLLKNWVAVLVFFIVFLNGSLSFAQNSIDFNASGNTLTYNQYVGSRLLSSTYPVNQVFYTFDQQLNRVSIFYNTNPRTTIFAGFLNEISIAGRADNNSKLLELNNRLGGGTGTAAGSVSPVVTVASNSVNQVVTDTAIAVSNTLYWCVCNTGTLDAEITFTGGTPTKLLPGMCIWEGSGFDESTRSYYLPSSFLLTVPNRSFVQLITRSR